MALLLFAAGHAINKMFRKYSSSISLNDWYLIIIQSVIVVVIMCCRCSQYVNGVLNPQPATALTFFRAAHCSSMLPDIAPLTSGPGLSLCRDKCCLSAVVPPQYLTAALHKLQTIRSTSVLLSENLTTSLLKNGHNLLLDLCFVTISIDFSWRPNYERTQHSKQTVQYYSRGNSCSNIRSSSRPVVVVEIEQ